MGGKTLTLPTDEAILSTLADGKRQTPKSLGSILDQDRGYMSKRLRALEDFGYVQDPIEDIDGRSGMYEITDRGQVAAERIDAYVHDHHDWFDAITEHVVKAQPPDDFMPELIVLTDTDVTALYSVRAIGGKTGERGHRRVHMNALVDSAKDVFQVELSAEEANEILYRLHVFGLLDRHGMDVYSLGKMGRTAVQLRDTTLKNPVELTNQLLHSALTDFERQIAEDAYQE